jgi:factor associated with neutral sphingomyelinase activation
VGEDCITTEKNVEYFMKRWLNGEMSNFDYLMLLNSYAQRSMQDLTQYPVMPWVIKDYKSPVLDLSDPMIYRDLSQPIGALDVNRLKEFRQRYDETPDGADKFLYGSHFSCPGYVIGFHIRSDPQWMIKFQSGKFDNPNRMFKGINKEWKSCNTNPTNVKELIPEFFMENTDFLVNKMKLDLGIRANGKRVDDVKLPTWASSTEDFLRKNKLALESAHVSNNLHKWIDLIFGFKQNQIEYNNVYHPYSYEGYIDFDKVEDPAER